MDTPIDLNCDHFQIYLILGQRSCAHYSAHNTEVRFASFLSGGFIIAIVKP